MNYRPAYLMEGSMGFSLKAAFMNMSSQTASPNSLAGGLKRKARCAVQAFVYAFGSSIVISRSKSRSNLSWESRRFWRDPR